MAKSDALVLSNHLKDDKKNKQHSDVLNFVLNSERVIS